MEPVCGNQMLNGKLFNQMLNKDFWASTIILGYLFLCQDHLEQFLVSEDVRVRESWDQEDYLNRTKEFSYTTVGFSFSSLIIHK